MKTSPDLLLRVSETTGQLTAPVFRTRLADRPATRVAKPNVSSPVIFTTGSPTSNSPLKDFLDSPATRREAQYQRQIEQRNQQNRHLRTQLEGEKTEKQFALEELNRVQEERLRLQQELAVTKQAAREQLARAEKERDQGHESDLQTRFHANLDQLRDEIKYRESVERDLAEAREENEKLSARFNTLGQKLNEATDDKHRVEISLEDMRHNLTEAQEERTVLGENLAEAQTQIEELMQLNVTGGSGGLARRQSLAPSLATFHTADMTNVSIDGDDSVGVMGTSNFMEEDMGDVAKQQWEERLERVELERNRVEMELAVEKEMKERLQVEFTQENETRMGMETKLAEETFSKQELQKKLQCEKAEKDQWEIAHNQEMEERAKLAKQLQEEVDAKKNLEDQLAAELQVREKLTEEVMQEKVGKEDVEKNLREQKENTFKIEELLGQEISALREELQNQKLTAEDARQQAEERIGMKIQEIGQLGIRLKEESSLNANKIEEGKVLLAELEEMRANEVQLRNQVTAREEQVAGASGKLLELEGIIQEERKKQDGLGAELANVKRYKAEMIERQEQMSDSHLKLESKLQEEQEAKAQILSENLQLEEAKATLAREAEEQKTQLEMQLSQV